MEATILLDGWKRVWDAEEFTSHLKTPAFTYEGVSAILDIAAQCSQVVRAKLAASDVDSPLEGSSVHLLREAVGGQQSLDPADPRGFVTKLVHAVLTNEGEYIVASEEKVDAALQEMCADLLAEADALLSGERAMAQLAEASAGLQTALATLVAPSATHDANKVAASASRLRIAKCLRKLALDIENVLTQEKAAEEAARIKEAKAVEEAKVEEDVDMGVDDDDEEIPEAPLKMPRLERTKSQIVKQVKINEVSETVKRKEETIHNLTSTVNALMGAMPAGGDATPGHKAAAMEEALVRVDSLQKRARNFAEDMTEAMLALDNLANLAPDDREVRKKNIGQIESLLDELDNTKATLGKVKKEVGEGLEKVQAEQRAAEAAKPKEAPAARPRDFEIPDVDWSKLRLNVKFTPSQRPNLYSISAGVPGLLETDFQLDVSNNNLRISGTRVPRGQDLVRMHQAVRQWVSSLPPHKLAHLTDSHLRNLMLQLGEGKYGFFEESFNIPHDVYQDADRRIEADYVDGVIRIYLPRAPQQQPFGGRFGGGFEGRGYDPLFPSLFSR